MILREREFHQKLDAAKAAAPFMHRKMPIAIEGPPPPPTISTNCLRNLSKPEILLLRTLLAKAGFSTVAEGRQASPEQGGMSMGPCAPVSPC